MMGPYKPEMVLPGFDERKPHQGTLCQIEILFSVSCQKCLQQPLLVLGCFFSPVQILPLEIVDRLHNLDRLTNILPRKTGSEHRVPLHTFGPCAPKGLFVEHTFNIDASLVNIKTCAWNLQTMEEHALLHGGQGIKIHNFVCGLYLVQFPLCELRQRKIRRREAAFSGSAMLDNSV